MTTSIATSEEGVRADVRSWLAEHWDPAIDPSQWRKTVVDSGWAFATWPTEYYGHGLAPEVAHVVEEEFEAVGATSPSFGAGLDGCAFCMGNAMLAHGSEEMKRGLLGQLLRGELGQGCYLYSEPGAGSDLGGLQTRAERVDDGYIINGQKIWSSQAKTAGYGMLVARTNWDVPKHQGLSYFLFLFDIDGVKQEGVDIRPIAQMNGESHFNEVFFTNAWVSASNILAGENEGWRVLQTALTFERIFMSRLFRESEVVDDEPVLHASNDLIAAATSAGMVDDPVTRQHIAQIHTWRLAQRWNSQRAAEELKAGGHSSVASLGKLANSRILHSTARLLRELEGPGSLLYNYEDFDKNSANYKAMSAFTNSIGGGSDQIQRNIIGERILGLPRGPEPDKGVPFKDVRKGVAVRKFSGS